MKKLLFTVVLSAFFISVQSKELNKFSSNSKIEWKGTKPVGGSHNGEVSLESVKVTLENNSLSSGEFVINMKSIDDRDLSDKSLKEKLDNHLKSKDFFYVEVFPTSKFIITKITPLEEKDFNNKIEGDLTVRGITNKIEFKVMSTVSESGDKLSLKSETIKIDRTKWDVKYNSGSFFDNLKDKLIDDIIQINFNIEIIK